MRNFLWNEKAGNARSITDCEAFCVLAYPGQNCIQTVQKSSLVLSHFLWNEKMSGILDFFRKICYNIYKFIKKYGKEDSYGKSLFYV